MCQGEEEKKECKICIMNVKQNSDDNHVGIECTHNIAASVNKAEVVITPKKEQKQNMARNSC